MLTAEKCWSGAMCNALCVAPIAPEHFPQQFAPPTKEQTGYTDYIPSKNAFCYANRL
jgi:hypothetical protein